MRTGSAVNLNLLSHIIEEGPNKPKELGTTSGVAFVQVMTSQTSGPTFSPMIKCESRNQDLLNAEPTIMDEEAENSGILESRPLQTEADVKK